MEIIQASSYHLVDVLFLLRECINDMNNKGLKQWNSAHPSSDEIREDLEKGSLFLYTEMKIARGIMRLSEEAPKEYEGIDWKSKGDKVLFISRFAVHPVWLDTDMGSQMMDFAEKYAADNGYTSIRLDILDSYPVDEKFYAGRNFTHAGEFHTDFQKLPYSCYEKNL